MRRPCSRNRARIDALACTSRVVVADDAPATEKLWLDHDDGLHHDHDVHLGGRIPVSALPQISRANDSRLMRRAQALWNALRQRWTGHHDLRLHLCLAGFARDVRLPGRDGVHVSLCRRRKRAFECHRARIRMPTYAHLLTALLPRYPTSGGQYHWVAILAPPRYSKFLSWLCGTKQNLVPATTA